MVKRYFSIVFHLNPDPSNDNTVERYRVVSYSNNTVREQIKHISQLNGSLYYKLFFRGNNKTVAAEYRREIGCIPVQSEVIYYL